MDPREMEALIQRLVANPHDEAALAYAHQAGTQDPRSYALLLEKVGQTTTDPAYAAHWLSEAANVWSTTIGDARHAALALMAAIDKDPTQRTAAERLAQLYRDKGDQKGLVALLERLAKSLTMFLPERPEVRDQLVAHYEELGRLWTEPPLARPERAIENWRRLIEIDPANAYAVYAVRELHKAQEQYVDALPYFAMEHALVDDPERKLALFRDEADIRRRAGDLPGATQALRNARAYRPDDVGLTQELGLLVLERADAGEPVPPQERDETAQLFVSLAEMYDGEYGYSYAVSALRASPGNDRAMQLADHYGKQLGRTADLAPHYAAYLRVNPAGFMAAEARSKAGAAAPARVPLPPPPDRVASPAEAADRMPSFANTPAPGRVSHDFGPSSPSGELNLLLEQAQLESQQGKKPQALAKFRDALRIDPSHPEALAWVEDYFRQKRMYAELRDVLLAAARVTTVSLETRKAQLRDVAGLCESQLRDIETAIAAWKQINQIDRGDEQARDQLRRLLERGSRWDDLATLLEQEAMGVTDVEQKILLEKKLAALHEQKRKDPAAAAEAWARIATLAPEDDAAIQTAVKLYERGDRFDQAAQVIADNVGQVTDANSRGVLLQKLGDLRLKLNDASAAGDAYAEAATALEQPKLWEHAEKAYMTAGRYADAASALDRRADLAEGKQKAALYAQVADLYLKSGDAASALGKFELAAELDPQNDNYALALEEQYRLLGRESELVKYLLGRADKLADQGRRVAARRSAAELQRALGDRDGARESLLLLLKDGDDEQTLALLLEDATERADHEQTADLLRRLGAVAKNPAEKLDYALREAALFAELLGDVEGAIGRYETIFRSLDPRSRVALRAIADLEERRGNAAGAADALERDLPLEEGSEKLEVAQRLARLYEGDLAQPRAAIKALDLIHAADPEDLDVVARLRALSERVEDWPRVAVLSQLLIEVEGDEDEASRMTRDLAVVLYDRLGKGDEALAALEKLADQGDAPCRTEYVRLGDLLGWKGIVATKLVAWHEAEPAGPTRNEALHAAFDRFVEVGREQDAARVAMELAQSRAANASVATRLEELAVRMKDLDALAVAHDILVKETSGAARSLELVRQAEVQVAAGVDPLEALQHGEGGLASVAPGDVEPLLTRLAALTQAPGHTIDLYERQVGRCRQPADRLPALARAAQVAAELGANDRARGFFELALSGGAAGEALAGLEEAARAGDARDGGTALRHLLAEALAAGGQGSRDGGRTRAALLRRAAEIAYRELGEVDRAFGWLGDALITHVDESTLDLLEGLGGEADAMRRVEATLGRALEEVFDGPLVRKLLHRRARLRREVLGDRKGASLDLKKLHDLTPSDVEIAQELSALLLELGDHRGMIQLYEDQILRGRDVGQRAELARKVARLWEEEVGDAREAADAWRRVLRMKAADPEATAGLERAKTGKLKKPAPPAPPPRPSTPVGGVPVAPPALVAVAAGPAVAIHDDLDDDENTADVLAPMRESGEQASFAGTDPQTGPWAPAPEGSEPEYADDSPSGVHETGDHAAMQDFMAAAADPYAPQGSLEEQLSNSQVIEGQLSNSQVIEGSVQFPDEAGAPDPAAFPSGPGYAPNGGYTGPAAYGEPAAYGQAGFGTAASPAYQPPAAYGEAPAAYPGGYDESVDDGPATQEQGAADFAEHGYAPEGGYAAGPAGHHDAARGYAGYAGHEGAAGHHEGASGYAGHEGAAGHHEGAPAYGGYAGHPGGAPPVYGDAGDTGGTSPDANGLHGEVDADEDLEVVDDDIVEDVEDDVTGQYPGQ